MQRGFHLLDSLLACTIILVSIQGALLLMQRTRQFEGVVQEQRVCWDILKRMRNCPVELLEQNESLAFSYLGEWVETDGFFQVRIARIEQDGFVNFHILLSFQNRLGQTVSYDMERLEMSYE